ncbi:MAG: type IX secretion system membrane protein PorP/SprF [Prolixibacteraceae bacterium]|jgi:type IX secretion system PorP/SprF family membrane protein|nr:type IX secretion system membrane protein PorP/SprF [Prolixibacteraceae bacterium]
MKLFITIFLSLLSLLTLAQQDAGFSMYFFNPVYVNPGYAGSRELFSGSMVHRSQWAGMRGSPVTQSLSMHSAIPNTRVGLGFQFYNDKVGPMDNIGFNLTYAYHLPLGTNSILAFGLSGMTNNIRIGFDEINIEYENDPAFSGDTYSSWVYDACTGIYFYKPRFYAGLSVNHLLQSKFGLDNLADPNLAKFYRQYYLTSGIVFKLNEYLDFRPSLLIKYVQAAPLVTEVTGSILILKTVFVGIGYRTNERVDIYGSDNMLVAILEFNISRFLRLGYSYDYYLNRTGRYNNGTHEIMLGWDIGWKFTKMSKHRYF